MSLITDANNLGRTLYLQDSNTLIGLTSLEQQQRHDCRNTTQISTLLTI